MELVYLDNNATTMVSPEVTAAMLPYFGELYANPSSMYAFGGKAASAMEVAREQVANLIGADPSEILFTSSGSESDNTAFWSALQSSPEKKHIVTTRVEHPAVLNVCKYWERKGYQVTYLGVDRKGDLDLEEYKRSLQDNIALVSIMYANNEVGNIYPIKELAEIAKERDILFHTDAVQAVGKIPIDLKNVPVDMLSLSGHKIHAPKGIGVLYIRKGTKFRSFIRGGHQEHGRRAGTENVPYIVGLGVASQLSQEFMDYEQHTVANLRNQLEKEILQKVPDCLVNGDIEHRTPNTTNISFRNVEGEAILLMLDRYGIAASSGSACTSGSLEPSHVLRAMGVPFNYAHGSIRFSLSRYTTSEEIQYVVEKVPGIIETLRKISPFKN